MISPTCSLPLTTSALIAIDSIRKLVPKKLFDELAKAEKADSGDKPKGRFAKKPKGVDGYGGRAAQLKAALNAAWMDELVPLPAVWAASSAAVPVRATAGVPL